MTIQEMFEREDIYDILEKTLTDYYKEIHGVETEINVRKKSLYNKMLIYPRLGMIFSVIPSIEIIKECYKLFDVKDNLLKKIIAWSYITICLLTFGLLAHRTLISTNEKVFDKHTLIVPNNRKIRIFNYETGYVDAIVKKGFNDFYFNNEIEKRNNLKFDFIPPIESFGQRWYKEMIFSGRCLVRTKGELYIRNCNKALDGLKLLAELTLEYTNANDYVEKLYARNIKKLFDVREQKHIQCYEKIKMVAEIAKNRAIKMKGQIPIALTHGDLQSGNIWVNHKEHQTYILDWETSETKSIWYDCATLILSTRRRGKFSFMVNHCNHHSVITAVLRNDSQKYYDMHSVMGVLFLEEMQFFLDEILDLPGEMGSEIIERLEYEIDHIEWNRFQCIE